MNANKVSSIIGKTLFVFLFLFALSACKDGGNNNGVKPPTTNPPPTTKTFLGQVGSTVLFNEENFSLIVSGQKVVDIVEVNDNANEVSVVNFGSEYPKTRNFLRMGIIGEANQSPEDAFWPFVFYKNQVGNGYNAGTICLDIAGFGDTIINVQGAISGKVMITGNCATNPADVSDTWETALMQIPSSSEASVVWETGTNIVMNDVDPSNRFPVIYVGNSIVSESGVNPNGLTIGADNANIPVLVDARTGSVCMPIGLPFGWSTPKVVAEPDAFVSYPYTNQGLSEQMGSDLSVSNVVFLSNCVFDPSDYE